MDAMFPLWQKLYSPERHTLFQSFWWNRAAAQVFAQTHPPLIVAIETDNGAAIIPACIDLSRNRLELLGERLFDYRDVLVSGESDALDLGWEALAELGMPFETTAIFGDAPHWGGFHLQPFAAAPRLLRTEISELYHCKLARMFRRLIADGCELRHYTGKQSSILERIYTLKAQQLAGKIFQDTRCKEMIIMAAAASPEQCDIFTLESAGDLVAALVTFLDSTPSGYCRRFYTTYFDERWARYSPGLALLHTVSRQSLELGFDCDYMTGEQPYKLRLATSSVPLFKASASVGAMQRLTAARSLAA